MAGVISVRFAKDERAELRRRWKEGGFPHLSAYIRTRMGFDAEGGLDAVGEYEDLDTTALIRTTVELKDRVDGMNSLLKQIARNMGIRVEHLDVPRPYTHVKPVDPPDENGHVDIATPKEMRTPVMPTGFER